MGGSGSGNQHGPGVTSDRVGSAPVPGKKRRLWLQTITFVILSFENVNYYYYYHILIFKSLMWIRMDPHYGRSPIGLDPHVEFGVGSTSMSTITRLFLFAFLTDPVKTGANSSGSNSWLRSTKKTAQIDSQSIRSSKNDQLAAWSKQKMSSLSLALVVSTNKRSQAGVSKVYLALNYLESNSYNVHFTITSPSPTTVCRCSSPLHLHWPAGT